MLLSLGSNLQDRIAHITSAIQELAASNIRIAKTSSIYETEPWGMDKNTMPFINIAILAHTKLPPQQLLNTIKQIESNHGRTNEPKDSYQPRTLDIDIIDFNGQIIHTPQLTLPHPRLHLRKFVLMPILELAPEWQHPILAKTAKQLLETCPDTGWIHKLDYELKV